MRACAGALRVALLTAVVGCAAAPAASFAQGMPGAPAPAAAAPSTSRAVPESSWYASELRAAYLAFQSGDFERAVQGYERVAGRAEEPRIRIRALISLAMMRLMPSSKMHDVEAARVILEELDRRIADAGLRYEFFGEIELLELVAKQDAALVAARAGAARLRKDLAARDALIRQLRELSVESQ